ncbi:hypothetical protein [Paenibacillus sp. JDR-2]|uniref:hypothetical protein n=1 Tax=Paenibacillus sp. (strain JDR-2) TaxID=324057 RepID=UPI0001668CB3|nr:hypothetical protein [Paenibacillus sp. JDR-2]ACT03317.1 hypothetical protein Pjdr2_4703 [Paenibacillus sp. JDR-2]
MISKRTKIIITGILLLLLSAIIVTLYFGYKGTPWGKANFHSKAVQYLNQSNYTIPNEYGISTIHSFITGDYMSIITLPNGIQFQVLEDYQKQLYDNYYASKIEHTISNEASDVVKDIFGGDARESFHMGDGYISRKLTETSSYTNLGRDIRINASFSVNLEDGSAFADEDALIRKCMRFLEWIKKNNYDSDVYISNEEYAITIRLDELRKLDEQGLRSLISRWKN